MCLIVWFGLLCLGVISYLSFYNTSFVCYYFVFTCLLFGVWVYDCSFGVDRFRVYWLLIATRCLFGLMWLVFLGVLVS